MLNRCPFCNEPATRTGVNGTKYSCGTHGPDENGEYETGHVCDTHGWTLVVKTKDDEIERLTDENERLREHFVWMQDGSMTREKADMRIGCLQAENERLRAAISTPEVCAGVVTECVERAKDEAIRRCMDLEKERDEARAFARKLAGEAEWEEFEDDLVVPEWMGIDTEKD